MKERAGLSCPAFSLVRLVKSLNPSLSCPGSDDLGRSLARKAGAAYQLCLYLFSEKYHQDIVVFALLFFKQKFGEYLCTAGREEI